MISQFRRCEISSLSSQSPNRRSGHHSSSAKYVATSIKPRRFLIVNRNTYRLQRTRRPAMASSASWVSLKLNYLKGRKSPNANRNYDTYRLLDVDTATGSNIFCCRGVWTINNTLLIGCSVPDGFVARCRWNCNLEEDGKLRHFA